MMARPLYHVLSTMPVVWWAHRRWGPLAGLAALMGGVGIDLDHLVDLIFLRHRKSPTKYLIVPLHGWEYPLVLLALAITGLPERWAMRLPPWWRRAVGHWIQPRTSGQRGPEPPPRVSPLPLASLAPPLSPSLVVAPLAERPRPRWAALLLALAAGWAVHLCLDTATNGPRRPKFYLLLYRVWLGFDVRRAGWVDQHGLHGWLDQPWWRRFF